MTCTTLVVASTCLAFLYTVLSAASPTIILNDQPRLAIDASPPPPTPESIVVTELPLPPVAPNALPGSCTPELNSRGTGCINQTTVLQSGSFTPDGQSVYATVEFVGSTEDSIYHGLQIILIRTDGTLFPNGDPWRCVTCGVSFGQGPGYDTALGYPQAFKDGKRLLAGTYIIDCGDRELASDECSSSNISILPIRWTTSVDPKISYGQMRELRIHPDDIHLAWSSFTDGGQLCYIGRLNLNATQLAHDSELSQPHYDLTNVNLLISSTNSAPMSTSGDDFFINPSAVTVGEVRGFSGTGDEVTYIGYARESSNIDVFAIHLLTGKIRRLTSHPEYVDPVDISPDNQWHVVMDTRGSGRQMFLSAMRDIPPITDLLTTAVVASTRNNGRRRFFQPYLIDRHGDRGSYYGQKINAEGDGSPGSVNDENWNGLADPKWSPDGTKIVYHQALVTSPACGGANPLICPNSTAEGGRTGRIMLAHLTSREPITLDQRMTVPAPDTIPWATPFDPRNKNSTPSAGAVLSIKAGTYTLRPHQHSQPSSSPSSSSAIDPNDGSATITITTDPQTSQLSRINITYSSYHCPDSTDFTDSLVSTSYDKPESTHRDKTRYNSMYRYILNGSEDVTVTRNGTIYSTTWFSNLTQYDTMTNTTNTKTTSPDGFRLTIDIMSNIFEATGTLVSVVDGVTWRQPENGT